MDVLANFEKNTMNLLWMAEASFWSVVPKNNLKLTRFNTIYLTVFPVLETL